MSEHFETTSIRRYGAALILALLAPPVAAVGVALSAPDGSWSWPVLLAAAGWLVASGLVAFLGVRGWRSLAGRVSAELEHHRRLSLIAELTQKKVVIADALGRIEWVNKGFEELSGYSLAEVRGRTPGSIFGGPDKDPRVTETLRQAVHGGTDVEAEVLNHAKDGQPYWVRLELRAIRDEQGALSGFIGIESDITRRKALEFSLQAANERFDRVARQSGIVVWELDAGGVVTYVSSSIEEVLGHSADEVLQKSVLELLSGRGQASALAEFRAVVRQNSGVAAREIKLLTRTGEARYCVTSVMSLHGSQGEVIGYRGLFKDITERKLAEIRLQESEARFKRAMRGSSDGLWDLDLASGEVYLSTRFKELLGYGPDSLPDYMHHEFEEELIHPEHLGEMRAVRTRHLEDDALFDISMRMRCADGEYRWFRVRAAAERDSDGQARHLTGVLSDINDLKEAQAQLQWRALHDPLTGLANRQLFLNRLNKILHVPRRHHEKSFAVLSFDFDRFKLVNDLHGHDIGDELLCSIAQRLVGVVRDEDLVARFGGDEFLVLLDDVGDAGNVEQTAVRLVNACAEPHHLSRNVVLTCTASVGVIVIDPDDGRSADIILREADAAMYQAKAESRGSYRFFDRELRRRLADKAALEADLREAVHDDEFSLAYQPIVDLATGEVVSFEALLRWRRKGAGPVSPADFIPLAEESGLIVPIGRWVVDRACADLVRWRAECGDRPHVPVSVNVSRRELKEPGYQSSLMAVVRSHGLGPEDIVLEITETALIDRQEELLPTARSLMDAGFQLAMDDFGTGQSSLNSLVDLPISILKIDKMFIHGMCDDVTRIAIVNAVVVLARHLELKVIVEGIESPAEVAVLQAMDCQYGQGYLFARPMSAGDALSVIRNGSRFQADDRMATWGKAHVVR